VTTFIYNIKIGFSKTDRSWAIEMIKAKVFLNLIGAMIDLDITQNLREDLLK
jgi:hypothetical protein